MSKREIKAKRWGRKSAKRQMAIEPVIGGVSFGPALAFKVRYRKFGDGRVQLRDGLPDLRGGPKITWGEWYDWHDC